MSKPSAERCAVFKKSNELLKGEYDYVVFVGRFQPYHLGHQAVIQRAQMLARKSVVILIGSATAPRNIKNPFTFEERKGMIKNDHEVSNALTPLSILPIDDYVYNDLQWIVDVQARVQEAIASSDPCNIIENPTVAIIGLDKDTSTAYLKWFPQWKSVNIDQFGEGSRFDATAIRDLLFSNHDIRFIRGVVPSSTWDALTDLGDSTWKQLQEEFNFIQTYKKAWEAAPYAPTFVTVDSVVFQDGHVLLVKRGASPGKGLWALPGGFINQNEKIFDAALRELREETKLKVPEPVLRGSLVGKEVFDAPDRSLRGRTITHAFAFKLASMGSLPPVKGSDDAVRAKWISLSDIKREELFEDHFAIITKMASFL